MKLFDISTQNKKILCLGDLLLDRFVYGTVHRISPEAPVPVLKINRDFFVLGGAGNVVRNLSALALIETLLPDVLFKGADYNINTVVGSEVVQLNGGEVHLIDLKPGYSTTSTIEYMKKIA